MNSLSLASSFRLSYMPPLMVYVAAGISGLTGIVGTFFVKERLGLSAEFLAALSFWAVLPYTVKMVVGHVVDLVWRWKEAIVFLGAALLAAGIAIMIGLLADPAAMRAVMPAEHWFVLATLLSPVGYMVQDVVADAMTVEAVPRVEADGSEIAPDKRRAMHTTMQTLGRVAIIGGAVLVALANVFLMADVHTLPEPARAAAYLRVYEWALVIPFISVAGVVLAAWLRWRNPGQYRRSFEPPPVNWWILGGGLAFTAISLATGLSEVRYGQESIFAASMAIVLFLMWRLVRELDPAARATLIGTAVVIYVFRATPGPGAGATWWMIDALKFDQQFLSQLSLVASTLTLAGLFAFRRFMAERSIYYVVGFLTVVGSVLSLPQVGMYYGLHEWTAAHTGGVVDARFIALVDTALESPLGQIAMVPMLAWIANTAPERLKATYFAVMASFTNLALSAAQLGTKYLNQLFVVSREVRDPASEAIEVAADYSQLGELFIVVMLISLIVPLAAIAMVRAARMRSA
ncbi:MAG: hypothetical protein HY017_19665 [Betaproteobacteria bacterium]|nr:hypothetical protein [Betaproteobacteria bacterium]